VYPKIYENCHRRDTIEQDLGSKARDGNPEMTVPFAIPQDALKYDVEVREEGRVELIVPLAPGTRVVVFVIEDTDDTLTDLTGAAESSLAFWDNALDDENWNAA
jgi:hypothetical protein